MRVEKGSRTITRVTVFYQEIENGNIANQIRGFIIDYGKFIVKAYIAATIIVVKVAYPLPLPRG